MNSGIARRLDADMAQALTGGRLPVQPLVGTPAYMSPELLRGYVPGTESDLWALGVVLYEMATENIRSRAGPNRGCVRNPVRMHQPHFQRLSPSASVA